MFLIICNAFTFFFLCFLSVVKKQKLSKEPYKTSNIKLQIYEFSAPKKETNEYAQNPKAIEGFWGGWIIVHSKHRPTHVYWARY